LYWYRRFQTTLQLSQGVDVAVVAKV